MTESRKYLVCGLLIPVTPTHVGLALKKKKIGAGKLNGWGGVQEPGESMVECIVREALEEGGVEVESAMLKKAAVIVFHNETYDCEVHAYLAPWTYAELQETEEMGPMHWYERANLPLESMMCADRDWLPPVLDDKCIRGEVWYGPNQESVKRSFYRQVGSNEL